MVKILYRETNRERSCDVSSAEVTVLQELKVRLFAVDNKYINAQLHAPTHILCGNKFPHLVLKSWAANCLQTIRDNMGNIKDLFSHN